MINHYTKTDASARGEDLWKTARQNVSVILLSPEQLVSDGFSALVENEHFMARVCLLGVDEVHLCNSWGSGFQKSFTQIGLVHARLHKRTVMVLTTATLAKGTEMEKILSFFGLQDGQYFLIRHSNLRCDIQVIFCVLKKASTSGLKFPDLKEAVLSGRKTVVFCPTINQGDRVAQYCQKIGPPSPARGDLRVQTYNALNYPYYNTRTLEMFCTNPETKIIIATDSLMVGVNLPNVQDCIIATTPDNVDEVNQKLGRVGRDSNLVTDAREIVYITKKVLEDAEELANMGFKSNKKDASGKRVGMDVDMARMIVAQCKTKAQNEIYGNPSDLVSCSCTLCSAYAARFAGVPCRCSGCMPPSEEPTNESKNELTIIHEDGEDATTPSPRLTGKLREHANAELLQLRWRLYLEAGIKAENLPDCLYLPDPLIKFLLDNFASLHHEDALDSYICKHAYAYPNRNRIWHFLSDLCEHLEDMRAVEKVVRREKERERRRAKALGKARAEAVEESDSLYEVESEDETVQAQGTSTSMASVAAKPEVVGSSQPEFHSKPRRILPRSLPRPVLPPQLRRSTRLIDTSSDPGPSQPLPIMPLSPRKRKIQNEDDNSAGSADPSTPPRKYARQTPATQSVLVSDIYHPSPQILTYTLQ